MAARGETGAGARILAGVISGAHGVRGAVRIKPYIADADADSLFKQMCDETGRVLGLHVVAARARDVIATLDGVRDRDAAQALKGTRLYLPRTALPAPGAEEYYHADLIGLAVERTSGEAVGKVSAVHDFGAGAVIEIATAAGAVMVPFTRAAVPVVDLAHGRLVIEPPPGLPGFDRDAGE
ncbi:MAG TPA: ribosome maturation factor RimM [Alphaproteobacteria bacterium]